ncbi:MAG: MerR family transcriptional regulator [Saprospiraceae bacterium]|nr:MerR family transcriptional regulator [Saprospiraceae bacterium]MCF8250094.1 MerR family transcriptional regulator [Saprospiraceae bacterium]MCF8279556.1 MerR family transcriptional regulator [Bacteroidales bacterium]MCF8311940.1 MerR family transcriptional regulator [Saprospiraceae bacterium]MCF8440370.1 MerR family transcriptional regulator [Saprospiraceae bacterium]
MAIYSISDLEKLSGIKSHTIRIWEQRYGILHPKRTDTNIRFYEDDDLQRLLNVALLNRHGFRISKIAEMTKEDMAEQVSSVSNFKFDVGAQLDVLTLSVIEMDEIKFARIFDNHVEQIGFEETMMEVVYPFMEKLSLLWLTGSIKPVQENFITQLIRNKLIAAIEREPLASDRKTTKFLLYLPKDEQQELSILFMQYLIKRRGFRVVNIGSNLALVDLKDACQIHQPDYVFTVLSETFSREPVQRYLASLQAAAPGSHLLLTGYLMASQSASNLENATILPSLDDALTFLNNLKSKK